MIKNVKDILLDDFWIMPATPEYIEVGVPYITSKNIKNGKIDFSKVNYISQEAYETISKNRPILVGDILISMIGTLGETAEVTLDDGSFYGQNMFLIRLDETVVYKRYFLNYFKSDLVKRALEGKQNQSTQKYLKANHIEELQIPILPLDEQISIAETLDKIEVIINSRKEELLKMDNLIKARFVELFGSSEYPKVTISELVTGKVQSVKKVFSTDDEIKYIDISSIDNKRNVMTGYTEYVLCEAPSRAQQHIKKGDIVVSTVRPNLRNVALTEFEDDNLVASSGFCVLRAVKCIPEYLMAIVCSDKFTDDMTKVVTGANYPAIKDSDVMNYQVPMPPMELQNEFAEFVKQVDKSKVVVQKALDEAQLLFDSLMQKYFG